MDVASFVSSIFDGQLPFRVEAFDGSTAAPSVNSPANNITLKILSRDALVRFVSRPGELGLARAYVAGDIDVDGDLDALFGLHVKAVEIFRALLDDKTANWNETMKLDLPWIAPETPAFSRRKIAAHALFHSQRHWAQLATLVRAAGFPSGFKGDVLFSSALE